MKVLALIVVALTAWAVWRKQQEGRIEEAAPIAMLGGVALLGLWFLNTFAVAGGTKITRTPYRLARRR